MLFGTVGVAPGSYTLQLSGLGDTAASLGVEQPKPCCDQPNGPIGYGLPAWGWYDDAIAWYDAQFASQPAITALPISTSNPNTITVPVDPYGSDAELKGLRDATFMGYSLTTLFTVGALVAGGVIFYNVFKKRAK